MSYNNKFHDFINMTFLYVLTRNSPICLSQMSWGKTFFFELSVIWLTCRQQICWTLQNVLRYKFLKHFYYSATFSLETDRSCHCWYFFPLISCLWRNPSWKSQASIFDGFKRFIHVFLSKSNIVDKAITVSVMHICSFFPPLLPFCLFANVPLCVCVCVCLIACVKFVSVWVF